MTAQAQPVRHPWFDNPSLKRKRPTDFDPPLATPLPPSPISSKRLRCSTSSLEGGFSHLSLNNYSPVITHPTTQPSSSLSSSTPFSIFEVPTWSATDVVRGGSVEEPPSPDVPEVKMRNWYEPEKDRESPIFYLNRIM
jgi:hypothetical protein